MPSCAWQEDGVAAMQHLQVSNRLNTTPAEHAHSTATTGSACAAVCMCVCLCIHLCQSPEHFPSASVSLDLVKIADLMWKQSVWSSIIAAKLASSCLKE